MNKAVFLDRDGVLCEQTEGRCLKVQDFELLPHVPAILKKLKEKGFLLIVISNQGAISRKEITRGQVEAVHLKMKELLLNSGVELDAIYYCPHDPEIEACICRKPEPLMIQKGIARFNIDPSLSIMIGDSPRDIEAAQKAGVKGLMIRSNENWNRVVDHLT